MDISIGLPGASSDCIGFEGSDIYERLEGGLLKNGRVLYGDNAYINMRYIATPFPKVLQVARTTIFFSVSAVHPCRVCLWTIGQQVKNSKEVPYH